MRYRSASSHWPPRLVLAALLASSLLVSQLPAIDPDVVSQQNSDSADATVSRQNSGDQKESSAVSAAPVTESRVIVLAIGKLAIVRRRDSHSHLAYSARTGKWTRHDFPDGVAATAIVEGGSFLNDPDAKHAICAFRLTGKKIEELVAVDNQGRFQACKLKKPTSSTCLPSVDRGLAVYEVDDFLYAFSAVTGTWDVTEKPRQKNPGLAISSFGGAAYLIDSGMLLVEYEDRVAAFSVDVGKWTSTKLPGGE